MTKKIQEVIARLEAERQQLGITLYPPASRSEVSKFETKLKLKLPDDIKVFYQFCNGFESEQHMFRVIPLEEILSWDKEYKPSQFYLAEYMIYCDTWTIKVDPQGHNAYGICNYDEYIERICLTESFAEFLDCFINYGLWGVGGLYDWHEKVQQQGS